jgi:hypothetical protein
MTSANTCRTCGFTDCPSLTENGGCPRWPAPGQSPLFAQLTDTENDTLWRKLRNATVRYHAILREDLDTAEWISISNAELEMIELREELTALYGTSHA